MSKKDYISILAGGCCPFSCPYCVGHEWDQSGPPRFGEGVEEFLGDNPAKEISISGCTSDPLSVEWSEEYQEPHDWKYVLALARHSQPEATISLHTADHEKVHKNRLILSLLIWELCLTVRKNVDVLRVAYLVDFFTKRGKRVRLSSVCTEENWDHYASGEFFKWYPCGYHTVRHNIFEPDLKPLTLPGEIVDTVHGQPVYEYLGQRIALWDFRAANTQIDALYLWPDGQVRPQCYWTNLHPDEE